MDLLGAQKRAVDERGRKAEAERIAELAPTLDDYIQGSLDLIAEFLAEKKGELEPAGFGRFERGSRWVTLFTEKAMAFTLCPWPNDCITTSHVMVSWVSMNTGHGRLRWRPISAFGKTTKHKGGVSSPIEQTLEWAAGLHARLGFPSSGNEAIARYGMVGCNPDEFVDFSSAKLPSTKELIDVSHKPRGLFGHVTASPRSFICGRFPMNRLPVPQ